MGETAVVELALGTAQWGSGYGVTNRRGRLPDSEVSAIAERALAAGVVTVDTHRTSNPVQGYGDAQFRLRPWAERFAVTTKVFGGPDADLPVIEQLRDSLSTLGLQSVHACLVHDWYALDARQAHEAAAALEAAVGEGLVERVGVSAYDVGDVESAEQVFASLGAVQVPANVLDQRLVDAPVMVRIHAAGVEVQVRSAFLQGLLLDADAGTPLAAHPDVRAFHAACRNAGITPMRACLGFVRSLPWADRVVVGVTSAAELDEILAAWAESAAPTGGAVPSEDPALLDPRRWR